MDTEKPEIIRAGIGVQRADAIISEMGNEIARGLQSDPTFVPNQTMARLIDEFREQWFRPTIANIEAAVTLLPEPLEAMGGSLADAVQTLLTRLQGAEREMERLRQATPAPAAESPTDPGHGPCLMRVRNEIRKWQAGGVANAMETAPARLAAIDQILRDHLFAEGEEVPDNFGRDLGGR